MKKIIVLLLAASIVLGNFCIAFAETGGGARGSIGLRYATNCQIASVTSISGSTTVYYVNVKARTTISYIKATLKLVNSSGRIIKTTTKTLYLTNGTFKLAATKALTARGSYHATYTLNIYKSGKLVETIKGKSAAVKY